MNKTRQLVSADEATLTAEQHTAPCADCPWARTALRGWTGALPTEEWIRVAHGEAFVDCHCHPNQQCAGIAIYRANVAKTPRYSGILRLPKDPVKVFASPVEFCEHHTVFGPADGANNQEKPNVLS